MNTPISKVKPVPRGKQQGDTGSPGVAVKRAPNYTPPPVRLPAVGTSTVRLAANGAAPLTGGARSAASTHPTRVQVTGSPVWVGPATDTADGAAPAQVAVTFAAPGTAAKAGVNSGLLFGIARNDGATGAHGRIEVQLDTTALAGRYGGNYAQRLRFEQLPACALSTPQLAACQKRSPVKVSHDPATGRLTANIDLPAPTSAGSQRSTLANAAGSSAAAMTVLAADSAPAGSTGTYAATSLKSSDQWSAGGAAGGFSYSYPIDVPPALGGAAPDVNLSYSSADVDGMTASTNAQSSWIGTGWSYDPGYIERSYQPCSDDGVSGSWDTCWAYGGHEVTLAGNSSAGQIVYDDSSHTWHLSNDGGATIQLSTGANNGAYQGEYWVITQQDGTRYYYGAGHLPGSEGGTGTDPATSSAWTQPVYCPHSGDPCYDSSTGTGSFATNMAYRWNLDYVVDPHGNTTVYSYATEPNYYARGSSHTLTKYTRGGYLTQVAYGWRTPDVASAAKPAERVVFTPAQRCTGTTDECSSYANLTSTTAKDWPDTPYDQVCQSTGTCNNASVSYFSTTELAKIQTFVNEDGADKVIDTYTLAHSFPDPGDASSPSLWLDGITHTGNDATTAVTLPQVTFGGELLPNRVPGSGTYPDYNHQRLTSIKTETGEQISVTYTTTTSSIPTPCSQTPGAQVLPSATNNTMLCYQQYWTQPGHADPISDWFEKYVVSSVRQVDMVASSPALVTRYDYVGAPAWHRDDSPATKNAQRSWNQFRGFSQVMTETGDPSSSDPITETATTYLRGMNGDYTTQSGGSQRSVTVTDSLGDQVVDDKKYADLELETDVYDHADGTVQSKQVDLPWSAQTATHAESSPSGLPPETANFIDTGTTKTADLLTNGTWRTTKTVNVFASGTGLLQRTDTQGDQSLVGTDNSQETCTTTAYATPPASGPNRGMVNSPARETTVSVTSGGPIGTGTCPVPTTDNVVSDTLTYYDGASTPGVITKVGDATRTDVIDAFTNATPSYVSTFTGGVFDVYGRQTSNTDARGLTTTTAYTPATGELPTSTVDTNTAKDWTTTTTLDQGRQLPTKVVDLNGNTTTETYDGLGRLQLVWLPGRATNLSPSLAYAYGVNGTTAPSWTVTETLRDTGASYAYQYDIYDGHNRIRQTQSSALGGNSGSLVVDTFYDSHGWTVAKTSPYYETKDPTRTIYPAADASVPGETLTTYDGQGRAVASTFDSYAQVQWKTLTAYPGADRTDVTPPTGGTATSTFTDALGRTSALWSYTSPTPTGNTHDAKVVSYTYTPSGKTASVTGPGGQIWTYKYDLHGNQISETDPDTGTSSATYYAAGDLKTSTDARGQTLAYTYDTMGRKTAQYSGSTSGPLLASWTYDTAPGGLGLAATSTAYLDSAGTTLHYINSVDGYTNKGAPTGTTVTVESALGADEAPLAGSYDTTMTYMPISGLPASVTYGAHGGLPAETVLYGYDRSGDLSNLSGLADYMATSLVDPFGRMNVVTMGDMPNEVKQTNDYDTATGRISEQFLDKESGSTHVEDVTTLYNPAGMVTATKDVQDATSTDLQCYGYNQLNQLTSAWTDNGGVHTAASPSVPNIGGCNTTSPAASNLGGPAKYWQSFEYNDSGNRTTEVDHAADGNTTNDITHTYQYTGETGTGGQPDTLQSLTTTGPNGTTTDTYHYDPAGNTDQWNIDGGAHNAISYTPQGRAATVIDSTTGNVAGYTYDADGNLLLQRDTKAGNSTVTLYLSGSEQLTLNTATDKVSGLRYYPVPGGPTEVRSSDGTLTYEYTNAQNTGEVTISADASQTVTRRYFTPYGQTRGTGPIGWVDNRAFLNQPADPITGLDLLGARNYDPATGHFLQRDPVQELTDPWQLNGYTYAADNPVNGSDADGKCVRLDDLSGPCAETANTPAGKKRLKDIENDRRRQHARWRAWERVQRQRHLAYLSFLRRTGEDRIKAAYAAQARAVAAAKAQQQAANRALLHTVIVAGLIVGGCALGGPAGCAMAGAAAAGIIYNDTYEATGDKNKAALAAGIGLVSDGFDDGEFAAGDEAALGESNGIALGLSEVDGDPIALQDFADSVGAKAYHDWPSGGDNWVSEFKGYVKDGDTPIHFNLDGIDDPVAAANAGRGLDPVMDGHATAWELSYIQNNPSSWSRVTFYRNGGAVDNPFAP